jgi:hypothetical protein
VRHDTLVDWLVDVVVLVRRVLVEVLLLLLLLLMLLGGMGGEMLPTVADHRARQGLT